MSIRDVLNMCNFITKALKIMSADQALKESIESSIIDGLNVGTEINTAD